MRQSSKGSTIHILNCFTSMSLTRNSNLLVLVVDPTLCKRISAFLSDRPRDSVVGSEGMHYPRVFKSEAKNVVLLS